VLELRHMFFRGSDFRERPRQHEFGLEDGAQGFNHPGEGCGHPFVDGVL
jgi:hypothetical protein